MKRCFGRAPCAWALLGARSTRKIESDFPKTSFLRRGLLNARVKANAWGKVKCEGGANHGAANITLPHPRVTRNLFSLNAGVGEPASGESCPASMFRVELLPAPLAPSNAV